MPVKKRNALFVALAYAIFWVMLIGVVVLFSGDEALFEKAVVFVQVVGTWAPTFALLILFKTLYPGQTIKGFYKNAFRGRVNFRLLLVATVLILSVDFGLVGFAAWTKGVPFLSLLHYSFSGFLITLFSGATGEESGWRGHLQQSLEKDRSVLKSCLIVGVIWAFWHLPTWINFMNGFLYMIPLDILDKISFAFIIGICYHRSRNLFVPMWIHFVANMTVNGMQAVLIDAYVWQTLLMALVAAGYIVWYKRIEKKEYNWKKETVQ